MKNMLNYVKLLEESGMKKNTAESVIQVLDETMDNKFATKHDFEKHQYATKVEFEKVRSEMKSEFAAVRAEMSAEFAAVRAEMSSEFAAVRAEMSAEFAAVRAEMKAGFDLVNEQFQRIDLRFEHLENRITLKLGSIIVITASVFTAIDKLL